MKNIGIWIDKQEAKIITLENGSEHLKTVSSDLEDFNIGGGSGTAQKGGPQDVVQDSRYLEREKHQLADFFTDLVKYIEAADAVVIFGPAEAGMKLEKELVEKHHLLVGKVKSVEKADSMTENQLTAWVRDYFSTDK
jgi:hypothetical protein